MSKKKCPSCDKTMNLSEFYNTKKGPSVYCRPCSRIKDRKPRSRFSYGRARAKNRMIEWHLTFEEFIELRQGPCVYCGGPLPDTGAGLDRIDGGIGYTKANCVPCCCLCNHLRHSNLTFDEMKVHIGPAVRKIRAGRGLAPDQQILMHHQKNNSRRPYRPRRKGGNQNGYLTSLPARERDPKAESVY